MADVFVNPFSELKPYDNGLKTSQIFKGVPKLNNANLGEYQLYIGGRGVIIVTRMPVFMKKLDESNSTSHSAVMKNILEKGFISFDGINDISVNHEEVSGGNAGSKYGIVTAVTDEFREFSIKTPEFRGQPVTKYLETWATGIVDPDTDVAHYHGLIDCENGLEYTPRNHTMELFYLTFDPTMTIVDGGANGLENAYFITNISPTKVSKSHNNVTKGDNQVIGQLDLGFQGKKYQGPAVTKKAKELFKSYVKGAYARSMHDSLFANNFTMDTTDLNLK